VLAGQIWRDPFRSTLPIPGAIEAVEAFVDDHARFEHWPCRIPAGFAERDTLGALGAGGGGAAALTGQSAFAMFVASMAIAIPSLVRHDK
jgi:hypothetical protein